MRLTEKHQGVVPAAMNSSLFALTAAALMGCAGPQTTALTQAAPCNCTDGSAPQASRAHQKTESPAAADPIRSTSVAKAQHPPQPTQAQPPNHSAAQTEDTTPKYDVPDAPMPPPRVTRIERYEGIFQYPEQLRPTLGWLLRTSEGVPLPFPPERSLRVVDLEILAQTVGQQGFVLSDVNISGDIHCTYADVNISDPETPSPCRDRYLHMLSIFDIAWPSAITNKIPNDVEVYTDGQKVSVRITPGWFNLEFIQNGKTPTLLRMEYLTDETH